MSNNSSERPLKVAFIHPDLGIGGAERLVVDAALGLQNLGHQVELYTSYHDPGHCFEETRDGTLRVHHLVPPFPRSIRGKFHILFAHLRQLHLTAYLLFSSLTPKYDVYFVDQLSTCIPFLRVWGQTRVVFYCHFPDKLLANGAFVDDSQGGGKMRMKNMGLLKRLYRLPMDWLEEVTTRQADIILANSKFTGRVFKAYFPSIPQTPQVVYPGINFAAHEGNLDLTDADIRSISSSRPTLLSLNRFEGKKNALLALRSFALLKKRRSDLKPLRLVLGGGYDPRLDDNVHTLSSLVSATKEIGLTYTICSPSPIPSAVQHLLPPDVKEEELEVLFLLNFTTAQRTALLLSSSTLALLYTPTNEHFGIVPTEAMACSLPVLACNSGGPTESVLSHPKTERTGWLCPPEDEEWARALEEIVNLSDTERKEIGRRGKMRAQTLFGMEAMARSLEETLEEARRMGGVETWTVWRLWVIIGFGWFIGFLVAWLYA